MDELNELEAEMAAQDLEDVEIGSGAVEYGQHEQIKSGGGKQPAKVQSEEDELRALEQMMA